MAKIDDLNLAITRLQDSVVTVTSYVNGLKINTVAPEKMDAAISSVNGVANDLLALTQSV